MNGKRKFYLTLVAIVLAAGMGFVAMFKGASYEYAIYGLIGLVTAFCGGNGLEHFANKTDKKAAPKGESEA